MTIPSSRTIGVIGFLACVAAMAFAVFYLQGYLYLDPCPLCLIDRAIIISLGVVFLVLALHNPTGGIRWVYTVFIGLLSSLGIAAAGRHIWLQSLPPDQVPACGPHLYFIIENFPLRQMLDMVLKGSGSCAEQQWTFLGMSIPQQTLLVFVFFLLLGVSLVLRKR